MSSIGVSSPLKDELKSELALYDKLADSYAQNANEQMSEYTLAYRDLIELIERFKPSQKRLNELSAMEHGCGTGQAMRHLKQRGLINIVGCDINKSMLDHAQDFDPDGTYLSVNSDVLPFDDDQFDFVLSSFVILVIHSREIIFKIFKEIARTMKSGGMFVIINTSKEYYSAQRRWRFSESHMFKENESISSGSLIKSRQKAYDIVFEDYYWSDDDVNEWAMRAGFDLVHIHEPLGKESDGIDWLSEKHCAPFRLYVLIKK